MTVNVESTHSLLPSPEQIKTKAALSPLQSQFHSGPRRFREKGMLGMSMPVQQAERQVSGSQVRQPLCQLLVCVYVCDRDANTIHATLRGVGWGYVLWLPVSEGSDCGRAKLHHRKPRDHRRVIRSLSAPTRDCLSVTYSLFPPTRCRPLNFRNFWK